MVYGYNGFRLSAEGAVKTRAFCIFLHAPRTGPTQVPAYNVSLVTQTASARSHTQAAAEPEAVDGREQLLEEWSMYNPLSPDILH